MWLVRRQGTEEHYNHYRLHNGNCFMWLLIYEFSYKLAAFKLWFSKFWAMVRMFWVFFCLVDWVFLRIGRLFSASFATLHHCIWKCSTGLKTWWPQGLIEVPWTQLKWQVGLFAEKNKINIKKKKNVLYSEKYILELFPSKVYKKLMLDNLFEERSPRVYVLNSSFLSVSLYQLCFLVG